jgi:hypothetical protein
MALEVRTDLTGNSETRHTHGSTALRRSSTARTTTDGIASTHALVHDEFTPHSEADIDQLDESFKSRNAPTPYTRTDTPYRTSDDRRSGIGPEIEVLRS